MGILYIVELCLWLGAGIFMFTQVIVPLFNESPLFPIFRSDWKARHQKRVEKLNDNLNRVGAELDEDLLEQELENLRKKKTPKGQ